MEGLAQVVRGGLPSEVGPEEVHHLFSVEMVARREGKQLDEACRLPEPPCVLIHSPGPHRNLEAAEQLDAHGLRFPIGDRHLLDPNAPWSLIADLLP